MPISQIDSRSRGIGWQGTWTQFTHRGKTEVGTNFTTKEYLQDQNTIVALYHLKKGSFPPSVSEIIQFAKASIRYNINRATKNFAIIAF